VLDDDVVRARETARLDLEFYLAKEGYRRTLRRLGFTEHDLSGRGSDRLVDALVPHGGPTTWPPGSPNTCESAPAR
jgi:hypothetical protein